MPSDAWAAAFVAIFCTPLGWIGMIMFGIAVHMIVSAFTGKE
jgi:hypothetical protein